ncbi:MAG: hypothetical protein VZS44_07150 [Bacilli bacterium]|nr:hypothetical protein [Bacilli bacterium]
MYNQNIDISNKIISYNDLYEIFSAMNDELIKYQKINKNEELKNKVLDYRYQTWTFKNNSSNLKFEVTFYDNTTINFEDYNNFSTVFHNRLNEIKKIWVFYHLNYSTKAENEETKTYRNNISMFIYENRIKLEISLDDNDDKANHIYEMIKTKIYNSPERYDEIVRNKSSIVFKIGVAIAFIPSLIICTLLLFVPTIRQVFASSYVLFPIACMLITFMLSSTASAWRLDDLYKNISPKKKYAGYQKGYKDDIEEYENSCEILIGNNIDNMDNRRLIKNYYEKYTKYIPYELGVMALLSIIVIFLK